MSPSQFTQFCSPCTIQNADITHTCARMSRLSRWNRYRCQSQAHVPQVQLLAAEVAEISGSVRAARRPTTTAHKERVLLTHLQRDLQNTTRFYCSSSRTLTDFLIDTQSLTHSTFPLNWHGTETSDFVID